MCKGLPININGRESFTVGVCHNLVVRTENYLQYDGKRGIYSYIDGHYWLIRIEKL